MKKNSLAKLCVVLAILLSTQTLVAQKRVVYAIASKEIKCTSGNAAYTSSTDVEIKYSQVTEKITTEMDRLEGMLQESYGSTGAKIRSSTAGGKVIVIIRFPKNMSPYNCTKYQYSIGGGVTYDGALESAKKSNSVGNNPYTVVTTLYND